MFLRMVQWARQNLTSVDRTAGLPTLITSKSVTFARIGIDSSTMSSLAFLVKSSLNTGTGLTFVAFLVATCNCC